MLNRRTRKTAKLGIFSRLHSGAKSLEYSLGIKSRTAAQDEAGAANLATWRASHPGSPRIRTGVHGFLKTGKIPAGVPGAAELAAHVEEVLAQMVRERGVTREEFSIEQWGILNDQRRCLTALGLIEVFLYQGQSISEDDERLYKNLHKRVRHNFQNFQKEIRIDTMISEFGSFVYSLANGEESKQTATSRRVN